MLTLNANAAYPRAYCMPGTSMGRWSLRAPGSTSTSSVSREKQPCRVFTLFSFSCLWTARTMSPIWPCSSSTGLKIYGEKSSKKQFLLILINMSTIWPCSSSTAPVWKNIQMCLLFNGQPTLVFQAKKQLFVNDLHYIPLSSLAVAAPVCKYMKTQKDRLTFFKLSVSNEKQP